MKRLFLIALLLPSSVFAQTQHDRIDARGQVKTDKYVNRAVVVITGATPDVSTGNVFKTNNGGSTTITNFLNPADTQRIIIICGDGNTTIQNNANIVTSSGSNFSCGVNQSIEFTYDAAQAKWVQSGSVNGGGGGGSPGAPTNAVQKNSGSGTFVASAETSDGTTFTVNEDAKLCGPDPSRDIRCSGGYSSAAAPSTTGSISAASSTLTLANAQDFVNGHGIVVYKAGPGPTVTTPGQPTVTPTNVLNGVTTYTYQVIAEEKNGALSASSTSGSTSNGAATLGSNTITLTNCVRSGNVTTYTSSGNHNLAVAAQLNISGFGADAFCNGVKSVVTTPTGTTFTTIEGTVLDGSDNTGSPTAKVIACNTLSFPSSSYSGVNTLRYWIYRNNALVGVAVGVDPWYLDCGVTVENPPGYIPGTPPGATQPGYLATTITAGGGTTTLTLAAAATSTASSQAVLHDNSPNLKAALTTAIAEGGGVVTIPVVGSSAGFPFNSVLDLRGITGNFGVGSSIKIAFRNTFSTVNQPWYMANGLEIEGEPRQGASFQYIQNVPVSGVAHPLFIQTRSVVGVHFKGLQLKATSNGQTLFLADSDTTGQGTVGTIFDDTSFLGRGGKVQEVLLKGGFDFYFNRGVCDTNTIAFLSNSCIRSTNVSSAVTGGTSSQVANRIRIKEFFFLEAGFLQDCSPNSNLNGQFGDQTWFDVLHESMLQPVARYACPSTSAIRIEMDRVQVADTQVGAGTPFIDSNLQTITASCSHCLGVASGPFAGGSSANNAVLRDANSIGPGAGTTFQFDGLNQSITNAPFLFKGTGRLAYAFPVSAAPTGIVSAGGSATIGTFPYTVQFLDAVGNPGPVSLPLTLTTSGGNQTITFTAPTPPAGAINWYVFRNGARILNAATPISSQIVYNATPSGQSAAQATGGGVAALDSTGLTTASLKEVANGFIITHATPSLTTNRTYTNPDASGTYCITALCAVNAVTINGDATLSASPRSIPPIFLPGALTSTWTGASWTLDKAITVTRVQTAAKYVPSGCGTSAIIRLTDGVTPVNLTVNAATNDSGVISQNYAAGATLTVSVQTAASGCTTSPGDVTVLAQFRMQ